MSCLRLCRFGHAQIAARAQAPPRHRNSNRRHIRTTSPAKRKKSSAREARRRRYSAGQDQVAENGRRQARGRGGTKHRTPPTEGADCRPVRFGSGQLLRGNRPGGKGPRESEMPPVCPGNSAAVELLKRGAEKRKTTAQHHQREGGGRREERGRADRRGKEQGNGEKRER